MKVVILAGGKGTRLMPYTTVFPKPLVPIDERPILDIILEQLSQHGFTEVILAVGHLSELIRAYFGNRRYGMRIQYSKEDKVLGTAGPLSCLELNRTFLVMNGDVLTTLNYMDFVDFHKMNKADLSIVVSKRDTQIDFGVIEFNSQQEVTNYIEKPKIEQYVSIGIYMFQPGVLNFIPKNKKFDLPDLVKRLLKNKKRVVTYLNENRWLDIGRPEDYKEAQEYFKENGRRQNTRM